MNSYGDPDASAVLTEYARAFHNATQQLIDADGVRTAYVEAEASKVDPDGLNWFITAELEDGTAIYLVNHVGDSLDIRFHQGGHSVWFATTFAGVFGDELITSAEKSIYGHATPVQAMRALLEKMGV